MSEHPSDRDQILAERKTNRALNLRNAILASRITDLVLALEDMTQIASMHQKRSRIFREEVRELESVLEENERWWLQKPLLPYKSR